MSSATTELLLGWTLRQVPEAGRLWLQDGLPRIAAGDEAALVQAFALAPRRLGKQGLDLSPAEQAAARQARPGWCPAAWSADQAARSLFLLAAPSEPARSYAAALDFLFRAADLREQVALLQALPLLPHGECFVPLACEGVRSNRGAVLQAIAFDNPYPAERFSQAQWNSMVLKCLFLDLPVDRVAGLEGRMNAELARMVDALARERRSAGRPPPLHAERFVPPSALAA